jgi:hypothetical protein
MAAAPNILEASVLERAPASAYAACMSLTAALRYPGVGTLLSAPKALPVSWEDVENCVEESRVKEKPVMAVEAMGETAMSPVISEMGTVEMPVFARMA